MSEKIQETQQKLKDLGYFASKDLAKIVFLFEASGKRDRRSIPTLLLQGKSGVGKTFLAETFSKMIGADEKFVQCFPRMGTENFQLDVNFEGVIKQDADNSIKAGILLQTLQQSHKSPVVLVLDELDKARPEVDSFLLDFLENGRLTTGTDTYERGKFPIYTFITSNDKREIDDALINRSKKVEILRPIREVFLEILNLPEDHYLGWIYDKCPDFSIRQARQYLEDLEVLGTELDEDALSQYINLDELELNSLADLQHLEKLENGGLEVNLPDLESCQINLSRIDSDLVPIWVNLLKNSGEKFELESKEENNYYGRTGDIYVNIKSTHQLKILKQYGLSDVSYSGWFVHELLDDDIESKNIRWVENKSKNGTRFGLKINGDRMYKIAINRGVTLVYLDSSDNTLEHFLGKEDYEIEQEYTTDSEYDNYGREYDDLEG